MKDIYVGYSFEREKTRNSLDMQEVLLSCRLPPTQLSLTTNSNPSANGNLKNHLSKVSFVFFMLLLHLLRVSL
jgi:hypothetical protein